MRRRAPVVNLNVRSDSYPVEFQKLQAQLTQVIPVWPWWQLSGAPKSIGDLLS